VFFPDFLQYYYLTNRAKIELLSGINFRGLEKKNHDAKSKNPLRHIWSAQWVSITF